MRILIKTLLLALLPVAASAQDSGLKSLETSDAGRDWMAVGRLDIDGEGFCTGALVEPDLVLTAAHCLFKQSSNERIDLSRLEFLAGWRKGHASAYRGVRRAAVHPGYSHEAEVSAQRVRNDLALIELDRPIRNMRIKPFPTGSHPQRGQDVGIVSYAQDRAGAPSLQRVCSVMARQQGILVMSCDVDFGSSGAPVFSFSDGGPRIVSVVSAKAEADGGRVALGAGLEAELTQLRAELNAVAGRLDGSGDRIMNGSTSAKFIRP